MIYENPLIIYTKKKKKKKKKKKLQCRSTIWQFAALSGGSFNEYNCTSQPYENGFFFFFSLSNNK